MSERYISRPQVVEAVQFLADWRSVARAFPGKVKNEGNVLMVLAGKYGAQGWVPVPLGHWVVRNPGDDTDYWPVDPDYFAAKYVREQTEGTNDE